jgi:acyl-CoA synthetase (AMP-forming)/AMP-acid ligase II
MRGSTTTAGYRQPTRDAKGGPVQVEETHRIGTDTIGGLLQASAFRHTNRVAIVDDKRSLTYGQWLDRSTRLANALRAGGISPRDRVAVVAHDTVGALEAYFAVWLAGATLVQTNARVAAPELQYLLENATINGLLWTPGLSAVVEGVSGLDDIALRCVIDPAADSAYEAIIRSGASVVPQASAAPEDAAIIGYTSGSSGRPKGAFVSHRALAMATRLSAYNVRVVRYSRMAFSASLSFCAAIWGQVLPHLYLGGMVRLLGHYDIDSWIHHIRRDRSNWTYLPTPLIADFADGVARNPEILDHLVTAMHAGSVAPRPHLARAIEVLGGRYLESYGMTEVVGCITATIGSDYTENCGAVDILGSAGRPVVNASAWIANEDGSVADVGEEGEIVAVVDPAFDGYWNDPEGTASVYRDGVFRTGDAGRFDEEGYLYVTGRRSDMIVSGGMNVYPAEVERVLMMLPEVRQAAVFGIPHPRWSEGVATAIVLAPGASLDRNSVLEHCRRELAGYKKPTRIEFVPELPLLASQKVDKRVLRQQFADSAT